MVLSSESEPSFRLLQIASQVLEMMFESLAFLLSIHVFIEPLSAIPFEVMYFSLSLVFVLFVRKKEVSQIW